MPTESDLQRENISLGPKTRTKTRTCPHLIGTAQCQHCVNNGTCPSNIKTIEQIDDIEKGRKYCYGRS